MLIALQRGAGNGAVARQATTHPRPPAPGKMLARVHWNDLLRLLGGGRRRRPRDAFPAGGVAAPESVDIPAGELQADIDALTALAASTDSEVLRNVIDEVVAVAGGINKFTRPGTAYAERKFDPETGGLAAYNVAYYGKRSASPEERLANLVHELTHVSADQAYGRDFLTYRGALADGTVVPDRRVNDKGDLLNEAARQRALKDPAAMQTILDNVLRLMDLIPESDLSPDRQKQVRDKLVYIVQGEARGMEYDTCVNQILVWMNMWGAAADTPFYRALDKAARDACANRARARETEGPVLPTALAM